jgi:hypothetical protein
VFHNDSTGSQLLGAQQLLNKACRWRPSRGALKRQNRCQQHWEVSSMTRQRIPGSCGRVVWYCGASHMRGTPKLSLQNCR